MLCVQTHYRSPMEYSPERLEEAAAALERIEGLLERIDWACENARDMPSPFDTRAIGDKIREARTAFIVAMDDDFNTAGALAAVFGLVGDLNVELGDKTISLADGPFFKEIRAFVCDLMGTLGVEVGVGAQGASGYPPEVVGLARELAGFAGESAEDAVDALLAARAEARSVKNFDVADAVRDGLVALGFTIEDTPQGARVTFG